MTDFRHIRIAFRLCMEERVKHYISLDDKEHADIWKRNINALVNGKPLGGRDNSATDLFAKVYNEMHGDPRDYYKRFADTFEDISEKGI